jgi:hypothetical protein
VKDECCSMHHLAGVAPFAPFAAQVTFSNLRMVASVAKAIVSTGPPRLDRPPKSPSTV